MITTEASLAANSTNDRYQTRPSTVITVRMNAALKERIDARVKAEKASRRRVSMNRLCVQALISVLDQLDAAEATKAE